MTEEFLSPQNVCGKTLLDIVARGSALIAQMQRLSTYIPKMFIDPGKKYQKILHDFSYFKNMNEIQNKIQEDMELVELNESIKNTYLPLLERFYKLFQSIYTYYEAIIEFINQIQTGVFIQFSLENMLQITQGKQLICEAIYLFGVMLLLMDHLIEGPVRERIVLCYYRNKGGENISAINEVIRLCYDTKFRAPQRRDAAYVKPDHYPEDFFARFSFDKDLMESIIIAIKDDDIYKQMAAYPQAKLRSFALTNQGSMLFVILFFMPDVLNKAKATMREIVDKHFYNMWVIPFYLGYIVDLTEWWRPYKAAKTALNNILDVDTIQELSADFAGKHKQCYTKCKEYLTEGVMTDEFVIYNLNQLMNCLRMTNVSLRWLILHRKTVNQKLKEIILACSNQTALLRLMLICSQFEIILKEKITGLLAEKQTLWNQDKDTCAQRLRELSQFFGQAKNLGKIQSDESLKKWFFEMSQAVGNITFSNSTYASRKIQTFIQALEEIQEYHQVNSNIQVKTYLQDTRKDLDHMVKIVNVKKSTITSIDIISDITWSWLALKDYIKYMQTQIRKDPDIALMLKNTFMKLSSILNTPMVRMLQAQSPDIQSVSKFYSNELLKIVKEVLQIIPQLVFENLGDIINIFLEKMISEPQKFDKGELVKYAQFSQRLKIAKLTNEISVFAESILNMQSYLVGVIEINPREILEAGIKRELIKLIAKILQNSLKNVCKTPEELLAKLVKLSTKLKSFKLSLEYIQDFIHIYGLKMFYEEFQKLIYSYVDMEKLYLTTHQVGYEELNYDQNLPLPKQVYQNCNTFMGSLLNQILALINPKKCTFLQAAYGFYDVDTKKEVLSLKTLHILQKCIGISGLQGLDFLLSMKIMELLKKSIKNIKKVCDEDNVRKMLQSCYSPLKNIGQFSQKYDNALVMLKKQLKGLSDYLTLDLTDIGHYILLRDMICLELRMLGKIGSPRLNLILNNLNQALMSDMIKDQAIPESEQNIQKRSNENLLFALCMPYFSHVGMLDPMKKIFITSKHIESLPLTLFITICINITNMDYDQNLKSLTRTKKSSFEPNYYLAGLLCLLNQFHPSTKLQFFAYMANYIKSSINFIMINKQVSKNPQLIADLFTYIRFFEESIKFSKESYEKYKEIIDLGLFSSLDKETLKNGYKLL